LPFAPLASPDLHSRLDILAKIFRVLDPVSKNTILKGLAANSCCDLIDFAKFLLIDEVFQIIHDGLGEINNLPLLSSEEIAFGDQQLLSSPTWRVGFVEFRNTGWRGRQKMTHTKTSFFF
jgi:hypothetical protein